MATCRMINSIWTFGYLQKLLHERQDTYVW
jgi:hypothetical protein